MTQGNLTPEQQKLAARAAASPIAGLILNIQGSPFKAAPEREKELDRLRTQLGVTIELAWPGTDFLIGVYPGSSKITVGLCTLERLWAYAYGYYATYLLSDKLEAATMAQRPQPIADLLHWAHTGALSTIESPWPNGSPRSDQPESGEHIPDVNEIFLLMTAWLLLHELRHISNSDCYDMDPSRSDFNHAIEFEADRWAFSFIMDHWKGYSPDSRVFIKRGLGIAFAMIILSADRFYKGGRMNSHTHPHVVDRLLRFFEYLRDHFSNMSVEVARIEFAACSCLFGLVALQVPNERLQIKFRSTEDCMAWVRQHFAPINL